MTTTKHSMTEKQAKLYKLNKFINDITSRVIVKKGTIRKTTRVIFNIQNI